MRTTPLRGPALWADILTALRVVMGLVLIPVTWSGLLDVASLLLAVAWLSDFLDGRLARLSTAPTRLGRWDMSADTIVGACLALGMTGRGLLPIWLVVLAIALLGGLFIAGNLAAAMLLQLVGFIPFLWFLWEEQTTLWWLPFMVIAVLAVLDWRRLLFVNIPNFIRGLTGRFEHR